MTLLLKPETIATIAITVVTPDDDAEHGQRRSAACARGSRSSAKRTLPTKPRAERSTSSAHRRSASLVAAAPRPAAAAPPPPTGRARRGRPASVADAEAERRRSSSRTWAGKTWLDGERRRATPQQRRPTTPPGGREQRRLEQELAADVAAPRARAPCGVPISRVRSTTETNMMLAIDDRPDHERDARDQDHQREGAGRDRAPQRLDRLRADDAERVVGAERASGAASAGSCAPRPAVRSSPAMPARRPDQRSRSRRSTSAPSAGTVSGTKTTLSRLSPEDLALLGLEADHAERVAAT